ncbi:hypothetical protein BDZ89DRAFT_1046524 [Hymenopellis radicata]|nr:hypothetical protein BDZ89DRAFT_1046524 [Hymenopellis radicata]
MPGEHPRAMARGHSAVHEQGLRVVMGGSDTGGRSGESGMKEEEGVVVVGSTSLTRRRRHSGRVVVVILGIEASSSSPMSFPLPLPILPHARAPARVERQRQYQPDSLEDDFTRSALSTSNADEQQHFQTTMTGFKSLKEPRAVMFTPYNEARSFSLGWKASRTLQPLQQTLGVTGGYNPKSLASISGYNGCERAHFQPQSAVTTTRPGFN